MMREYLKMIGRRILRQKIYAIINIMGLTIAFTAALLIYMHVVKEWKTVIDWPIAHFIMI